MYNIVPFEDIKTLYYEQNITQILKIIWKITNTHINYSQKYLHGND